MSGFRELLLRGLPTTHLDANIVKGRLCITPQNLKSYDLLENPSQGGGGGGDEIRTEEILEKSSPPRRSLDRRAELTAKSLVFICLRDWGTNAPVLEQTPRTCCKTTLKAKQKPLRRAGPSTNAPNILHKYSKHTRMTLRRAGP